MLDALFEQVKLKLNITWEDEGTNKRLKDIINSAIPSLIHKLGIPDKDFDFSVSGTENMLFKAYCLYEWEHCLNEFDDNYAQDIADVQRKHQVEYYLNGGGNGNETEI